MALKQNKFQYNIKEEQLLAFETVRRWKATIRNEETWKQYIERLWVYCTSEEMTPDELIAEKAASIQNPAMRGEAEDRLIRWHSQHERQAPAAALNTFKAVKSFFKANYVPLGAKTPTYVKQREEEYQPTKQEVKDILGLMDLETETFTLFCAESGQRDGTIADLKLSHVQECLDNKEPYVFIIPQKRDSQTKS